MIRPKRWKKAQSNTTEAKLQCLEAQLAISQEQLKRLLPSQALALLSMLGTDGKVSMTDLTGTLMQWYDTLSPSQKARWWTLIVDFFTLHTPHGTPSRDWS